eukprot:CAMPEP_0113894648 /NCGR_PEP_ID=MMETSP0780_2-20120614/16858_1 /TAXON_ID=652834 /ORGANISM="Palpitomonas bilix" /LENGTH=36 /DNA_ID=CAMNT_0000885259 /DNA_START=839 /DNA_END=949 /DNA_ORIENTATION=- /assembly_acc=CAM_ASM_000599
MARSDTLAFDHAGVALVLRTAVLFVVDDTAVEVGDE